MSISQFGTYIGQATSRGPKGDRGESGIVTVDTNTLNYNSTTKHLSLTFNPNDYTNMHVATVNPLITDVGYLVGSMWLNSVDTTLFVLVSKNEAETEANWEQISHDGVLPVGEGVLRNNAQGTLISSQDVVCDSLKLNDFNDTLYEGYIKSNSAGELFKAVETLPKIVELYNDEIPSTVYNNEKEGSELAINVTHKKAWLYTKKVNVEGVISREWTSLIGEDMIYVVTDASQPQTSYIGFKIGQIWINVNKEVFILTKIETIDEVTYGRWRALTPYISGAGNDVFEISAPTQISFLGLGLVKTDENGDVYGGLLVDADITDTTISDGKFASGVSTSGEVSKIVKLDANGKATAKDLTLSSLTTGIAHVGTTGSISSSLIVDGDITNSTIADGKLASGVSTTGEASKIVKLDANSYGKMTRLYTNSILTNGATELFIDTNVTMGSKELRFNNISDTSRVILYDMRTETKVNDFYGWGASTYDFAGGDTVFADNGFCTIHNNGTDRKFLWTHYNGVSPAPALPLMALQGRILYVPEIRNLKNTGELTFGSALKFSSHVSGYIKTDANGVVGVDASPTLADASVTDAKLATTVDATATASTIAKRDANGDLTARYFPCSGFQTCVGYGAGANVSAHNQENTLIGHNAGNQITTGQDNVCVGTSAGKWITDQSYVVCVGYNAGGGALTASAENSNSVFIGSGCGSLAQNKDNCLFLLSGDSDDSTELDTIRLGNLTQSKLYCHAIVANTGSHSAVSIDANGLMYMASSSRKYKTNEHEIDGSESECIYNLKPKTYYYKNNDKELQYGLIAEDVEMVNRKIVDYTVDGQIESVHYQFVQMLMLKEIQKLKLEVEKLKQENEQLKANSVNENVIGMPDTVPLMTDTQCKQLLSKPRQLIFFESNNDLRIAYQRSNGSKTVYNL